MLIHNCVYRNKITVSAFCPTSLFSKSSVFCFFLSQAVDDSGVPGMDRVDSLAEYPVELRNQPSLALTNQQVRNICCLTTFPLCPVIHIHTHVFVFSDRKSTR